MDTVCYQLKTACARIGVRPHDATSPIIGRNFVRHTQALRSACSSLA